MYQLRTEAIMHQDVLFETIGSDYRFQLYDLRGKLIFNQVAISHLSNIKFLKPGIYIILARNNRGNQCAKKLFVN
jgi:hypothetical protein